MTEIRTEVEENKVKSIQLTYYKEGMMIGRAVVIIQYKMTGKPMAIIEDVFVNEKDRGSGIGSELVKQAIELAKSYDVYKITLSYREHNVKFYEKLGFKLDQNTMRMNI
jgi:ribosomal protein S18 acetylase RimI-like enzyme